MNRPRPHGLSLRTRLMTIGLAGVAGALLGGGLLLYAVLLHSGQRTLEVETRASAAEVAALVDAGRLPDPVPVSGAQVVQVIDASGAVVAASATADRLTALVTPAEIAAVRRGSSVTVPGSRAGQAGRLEVTGAVAGPASDRVTVVAALPTRELESSVRTLRDGLLIAFPLLLLVLAAIAWRVIGSALRPVEALRHGAERIGSGQLRSERLPVPTSRDEIHALAVTLNGMLDRLDQLRRRQRAFVSDAAHELRSPLASMRTQLEVAGRLGDGGALPAELLPDVDRLTALVEGLLVLARSDEGAEAPLVEELDAQELLESVAGRYAAARVPVQVEPGRAAVGAPLAVHAGRPDLDRAISNLVDNAVRHARSQVVLAADRDAGEVVLSVSDDGNGIPEQDRERVFERFTRLDEARDRDSGGSGLGLAITRDLLARNGFTICLTDARPGLKATLRHHRVREPDTRHTVGAWNSDTSATAD